MSKSDHPVEKHIQELQRRMAEQFRLNSEMIMFGDPTVDKTGFKGLGTWLKKPDPVPIVNEYDPQKALAWAIAALARLSDQREAADCVARIMNYRFTGKDDYIKPQIVEIKYIHEKGETNEKH